MGESTATEIIVAQAIEKTLAKIEADIALLRTKGQPQFATVLSYVRDNLLDGELTCKSAAAATKVGDKTLSTRLYPYLGCSLAEYIERCRFEIGRRLLVGSKLPIGTVPEAIGLSYKVFLRICKKYEDDAKPTDIAAAGPPKPRKAPPPALMPDDDGVIVVDGDEMVQRTVEQSFWPLLDGLPFEAARHVVQQYKFTSPAFFDFLRRQAIEKGRQDRSRGVEIAELARLSVEVSGRRLGERLHELRVLGRAWLGNAQRLAFEFGSAEESFRMAEEQLDRRPELQETVVAGDVYRLNGALRISQQRYDEATSLLLRSLEISRAVENTERQVKALIHLASVFGYDGRPEEAVPVFLEARELLREDETPDLLAQILFSLANTLERSGQIQEAAVVLRSFDEMGKPSGEPSTQRSWAHGAGLAFAMAKVDMTRHELCATKHEQL